MSQPMVGNDFQFGDARARLLRRDDPEDVSLLLKPVQNVAQRLAFISANVETGKIDDRLFSEFEEHVTEIMQDRHPLRRHLIKHQGAVEFTRAVEQGPDERSGPPGADDWIGKYDHIAADRAIQGEALI